jgi:transcriptional regulator with PAS, ATPase and Fis domain
MALGKTTTVPEINDSESSNSIEAYRHKYPALTEIVGESQAILDLFKHLSTIAAASCTVLLEGDTGTGKQLTAEVLHKIGPRNNGPFIEVDCGAVPETLIESELFGHTKGSFTGANHDRKGVFELANGGTLFLDEVSNLPPSAQSRLLHVLQERRFRPIGAAANIEVDVRVIAASNTDLHMAVQEGSFREDLFYRLYVYPIHIPSLRERREDIPALASFFMSQCAEDNNIPLPELTNDFIDHLSNYDFPGNIRELRHIMERVLLQSNRKQLINASALDDAFPKRINTSRSDYYGSIVTENTDTTASIPNEPQGISLQGGYSRGSWVMEVLKNHRFNIRAAAENLSNLALSGLYDVPPLTDRSSLTYYLQGECFRLFLQENGDIDRVGRQISPDDDELRRIAEMKVQGYIDTAREMISNCASEEEAREQLSRKFSKLPGTYRNILSSLSQFLWQEN